MTPAHDTAPATEPASLPSLGLPQCSIECARQLASELAGSMIIQSEIIQRALSDECDWQAVHAWRHLRLIGAAMTKAMAALAVPQAGPDGDVVPDVKNGRLN